MVLALVGAGMQAAGSIGNTYGQGQALTAMRRLWEQGRREQAGYDAQVQARTNQLLQEIGLGNQLGAGQNTALAGQLNQGSINAMGAVQGQAARRPGRGAEAAAVRGQMQQGTLAGALRDNRLQAMIAGLLQGRQDSNLKARQYALDTGYIRDDARQAAGLMPMRESLASQKGAAARQIGTMFGTLGQAAMNYAMAQPAEQGNGGYGGGAGEAQAPEGGWAASKTYHNSDGSTGAWS